MTHHLSDPCVHCGLARDAVPVGECKGAKISTLAMELAATELKHVAILLHGNGDLIRASHGKVKAAESAFRLAIAANAAEIERLRGALHVIEVIAMDTAADRIVRLEAITDAARRAQAEGSQHD